MWDALAWMLARVPIFVGNGLGWGFARAWWYLIRIRRKLAEANVRKAFPEYGPAQVRRTLLAMMRDIVLSYIELLVFERTGCRQVVEHADQIPVGSLVLAGHAGAWEVALLTLAEAIPLASFVHTPSNAWVRARIAGIRQSHGLLSLETGATLVDGYAALEAGRSLLFVQDQRFKRGIVSPFFGHPCKTSPALAAVWLKTRRPVFACWQARLGPGKHRFWAEPLNLPTPTGDHGADIQTITDVCNRFYEERIREYPEGWLWLHDRWK